ncbi:MULTISPECIES: hypothetical protein [Pontibacter]|uniref:Uncharacterized protein n=1 Tax=Pontibacter lucknowensis TaxID=1077936 RepID=A0A1N6XJK5_9BACT|nr:MULTISPECIES: hypothetical protein [Pontibacter]EJF08562.1 hypothetical protein O71_20172 [Pontibacter sp. BAB1700]SIR02558.1 hypothetical protein SAMN05421545_2181 [Pontibacter lucknowensis]
MAEIRIEKKKKPVWPWILLVVILLLLGWAIYELVLKDGQTQALAAVFPLAHIPAPDLIADVQKNLI